MRRYTENLQQGLVAPPQSLSGNNNLKVNKSKLDKIKQFADTYIDVVHKAGEHQIAVIKDSTSSIFL